MRASYNAGAFDVVLPVFRYQDAEIKPDDVREFSTLPDGETVRVARQSDREKVLMDALAQTGLQKIPGYALHTFGSPPENAYALANESCWAGFMQDALPRLREAGWQIGGDDDFRHHTLHVDAWGSRIARGRRRLVRPRYGNHRRRPASGAGAALGVALPARCALARRCAAAADSRRRNDRAQDPGFICVFAHRRVV